MANNSQKTADQGMSGDIDIKYTVEGTARVKGTYRVNENIEDICLELDEVSKLLGESYLEHVKLENMMQSSKWEGDRKDTCFALINILGQFHNDLNFFMEQNKFATYTLKELAQEYEETSPTVKLMED